MQPALTKLSPAKLNLILLVGERLPSNFHAIFSLAAPIELGDTVSFRETASPLAGCQVTLCPELSAHLGVDKSRGFVEELSSTENLAVRAATIFFKQIGAAAMGELSLNKAIPPEAGLGGGSSNAASTLLLLNEYYANPLSSEHLQQLGATLGSDVPLFLAGTNWVLMSGRGEKVVPMAKPDWALNHTLILLKPKQGVSTKEAYLRLGREKSASAEYDIELKGVSLIKELTSSDNSNYEPFRNDFEQTVSLESWWLKGKEFLLDRGAKKVLLCGSGSTICGLFDSSTAHTTEALTAAHDIFKSDGWWMAKAQML